ncbi:Transcription initiation factor TFIID subunit 2 [Euphorbia peplus]|nr:Transcription initiation factor TFIID subunit 2 [Euphorbia peplus]
MAKPRKPKIEDPKPENSGAVVRHQKLCLSIDMDKRQIYGYTELEIVVPDIGIVGLHAENLGIENVFVDGEPTEFEYYPHQQNAVESHMRWSRVCDVGSAADAAGSAYLSALQKELVPNLLINCCKSFRVPNEQQEHDQMNLDNNGDAEAKQNVKLVRINYWVERAETGIHFRDNVLHTDNQIRRARCWFPCIDEGSQRCCYDLEFTVAHHLVAVSSGNLLYQVLSKDDFPRKTFVYKLDIPVTAQWISLVVAPFEILPDPHVGFVSHMCLSAHVSKLRNTVEFFHHAFNYYEEYLNAKFPFGSYTQIFLSPEVVVSSSSVGASISFFSSQILYDERVIDQTIDTSIKLAFALAKQWFGVYIVPEEPNDEWLVDGLAGFLTDLFIKKFLGNNEARYRRFKANCAVCKADDSGATALSSSASCKDLYGTHCIGIYGKVRSWKSVAILQMLEKQMGPEFFRKILQKVVSRAQDIIPMRSLSTKEFRHLATKVGNLERPFLKVFFPRWVCSCGCPILRMGFSYNKRKNMVEMAVLRECTAIPDANISVLNLDADNREGESGWPGMMSIRVYELDGMHDYPHLHLTGETWQLLEIQCHSKLAARRVQKSKKGSKPDGSDENGDTVPVADLRSSLESPLLWIRADPEMEHLAEFHFNQPVQMWINQLEKDEDVVAQAQAIAALEALPQLPFSVINALNNFLSDSKAFWRVRIEAAFALATTASEGTDWSGLLHLVKFYKSRRFDTTIGLPKPNDFHDFPEYFVLESIPQAVAMVRAADNKSPREAIEFVLQLLKYNDNTGNPYSDVFWLASLVQSVGQLEFGQQSVTLLSSLLKRIDRLLQFDRLMPSYNGILTISCIRTLVQIATKLAGSIHLDHVFELIKPYREFKTVWQIRIAASRALIDLEYHCSGIDSALSLFIIYLKEESTLRGQVKLATHAMRLCQIQDATDSKDDIKSSTLVALLSLLESHLAYNNTYLRHYLFSILQILAERKPTLYGVPRDKKLCLGDAETCGEPKNIFVPLVPETKPIEPSIDVTNLNLGVIAVPEAPKEADRVSSDHQHAMDLVIVENAKEPDTISSSHEREMDSSIREVLKEADTVSQNQERKMPIVKIRVRRSAASSRGGETDNQTLERSRGGPDRAASSSISVDAPRRNSGEAASASNQNVEEVNSCLDRGSRMTGSAKLASDGDNFGKELQCTAESSKVVDLSSPSIVQDNSVDIGAQKYASLQTLSVGRLDQDVDTASFVVSPSHRKDKGEKKDKKKKRKQEDKGRKNDPEYLERKRLKKEKKRKEKELAKLLREDVKTVPAVDVAVQKAEPSFKMATVQSKPSESGGSKLVKANVEAKTELSEGNSAPRFRIKIKNRTLNK